MYHSPYRSGTTAADGDPMAFPVNQLAGLCVKSSHDAPAADREGARVHVSSFPSERYLIFSTIRSKSLVGSVASLMRRCAS